MNYSDLVWKERTCGLFKKRHYLEAVAFTDNVFTTVLKTEDKLFLPTSFSNTDAVELHTCFIVSYCRLAKIGSNFI